MGAPTESINRFEPDIAGFFCRLCEDERLPGSGKSPGDFPASLKSVRTICANDVGPDLIRDAFSAGADGVLICGCLVGKCESLNGNPAVLTHIHQAKTVLKEMDLAPGRLRREWVCAPGGDNVRDIIDGFTAQIRRLGPLDDRSPGVLSENV